MHRSSTKDEMENLSITPDIDPDAVESLLCQEMNRMTFQQRNEIQEELHGVRSGGMEETPESIQEGLEKLQDELRILPPTMKKAYVKAKELSKNQQRQGKAATYIDQPDFAIRFLRADLWDCRKAAKRLTLFIELLLDLYGEYALQRPIQMSDFTAAELSVIKKGEIQLLPFRDRGGRRIFTFVSHFGRNFSVKIRVRAFSF
jgi:hypothetical protein